MRINSGIGTIVAIVGLFSSFATLTHAKGISEKEYWAAVYSAFAANRKTFPRQETELYEEYKAGKLRYRRTKTFEFAALNEFHYIRETVTDRGRGVEELFQIGSARYCKIDSSDWKPDGCYMNPPAALEPAIESTFSVDKTANETTYRRRSTFQLNDKENSKPEKFLTEDTLTLNADLSVRERTITKTAVETKAVVSRNTQKYEYRKDLRLIEAPIK